MKPSWGLMFAVVLLTSGMCRAQEMASGEAVVRAMHERYQKAWYETVKFTQKSTTYNPDGTTKVETWYEAAMLPGKLRIDSGPPSEGNAAILSAGAAFFFKDGKSSGTRPYLNMLLVLGFDVYRQAADVTIGQLKQEGFDLTRVHEEMWQGEPAYVVGADRGDLKAKQFWVEKKRLLFVRIIEPDRKDATKMSDTRFTDYRPLNKAMIAARVEVHQEGKLIFSEDYAEIQADVKLDPAMFDSQRFGLPETNK